MLLMCFSLGVALYLLVSLPLPGPSDRLLPALRCWFRGWPPLLLGSFTSWMPRSHLAAGFGEREECVEEEENGMFSWRLLKCVIMCRIVFLNFLTDHFFPGVKQILGCSFDVRVREECVYDFRERC